MTDSATEAECIHGLEASQCQSCKPLPAGLPRAVFVTQGGTHFHTREDCPAVAEGQRQAERRGNQLHAVTSVSTAVALETRDACRQCAAGPPRAGVRFQ